jgi:hypothetical protein
MTIIKSLVLTAALLVIPAPGVAQTTIAFDESGIGPGGTMKVTVTVPGEKPIARPRFHVVRDGDKTPGSGSRGWVDFPEIAATQEVTLRAPAAVGEFWLILNDGGRMVAREPFSVMSWDLVTELTMRRLARKAEQLQLEMSKNAAGAAPQFEPSASASGTAEATTAPRQPVRLLSGPSQARPGAPLDVIVKLPADVAEPIDVQLSWATTTSLGFVEKEREAAVRRAGSPVAVRASGKQATTVSMPAPAQAGEYDLLLMLGAGLLDAVSVTVR